MPQDNSIPLQAFQGESPVDNYLQALSGAKQQKRQEQQAVQQDKLGQQTLQMNDMKMHQERLSALNDILSAVPDGDAQALEVAKQRALSNPNLGLRPEDVANFTIADLPGLKIKTGQAAQMLDLESKRASIDASRASTRHSDAATQALRDKPPGNRDPNTGVRTPPQGTQNKDYAELQKISAQADAASNIAATLQGIKPQLDEQLTGKGFGWRRNVAGFMSMLPDFGIEKSLTGENKTDKYMNTYDAIEQASKTIGIDTLQKMGGSDTEMELKTAIQTTVNADLTPKENWRRFQNQIKASDILSKKAQLASEWVNKFGSLSYAAPDGTTWQGFWPAYQKSEWAKHQKQMQDTLARDAASRNGAGGKPQKNLHDDADAIVFGRNQ